jgi:hypothetical protein
MDKDPAVSCKFSRETFHIRDGLTLPQMNYLRKYINRGLVHVEYSFGRSRGRNIYSADRVYIVSVDPAVGEVVLTAIRLLLSENLL